MKASGEKVAVFMIAALMLTAFQPNISLFSSAAPIGNVDLFTQKEPYGGKGENVRSDAFGPEENVVLYCLVICNEILVRDSLVAFEITLPSNASFGLVALTNAEGIASVNFTITTPPIGVNASDTFGRWSVVANVLIGSVTYQDTLSFEVDWIVKLLSVRTVDDSLTHQTSFGKGGYVGMEVILRNKAMITKSATLAIVLKDELNVPISYAKIAGFNVQSNEQLVFVYLRLGIPRWAYSGNATIFISALTAPAIQGGVPYCPPVSTNFVISSYNPLDISFCDAAIVDIIPSSTIVEKGQPLNVCVRTRNEGTDNESFNVSTHIGDILVGTLQAIELTSFSEALLNFTVDTSSLNPGSYTLSASIPNLLGEADSSDNNHTGPIVEISPQARHIVHDVAVVSINTSANSAYIGETVQINVSVVNKGTETESFSISAYAAASLIGAMQASSIPPTSQVIFTFVWNTGLITSGFYQLGATALLPSDADTSDNTLVNGYIEVKNLPPPTRDIAIKKITPESTLSYLGTRLNVDVLAKNEGNTAESFNVILYSDSNVIGVLYIANLAVETEQTLTFQWNLTNLQQGNYTLTAYAPPVQGETDIEDNTATYGPIRVTESPAFYFDQNTFNMLFLFLLILLILLLSLWFLAKRKRKKHDETFYTGWTAWYYCYDPRGKPSSANNAQRNLGKEI
jgi:hypothetical protein